MYLKQSNTLKSKFNKYNIQAMYDWKRMKNGNIWKLIQKSVSGSVEIGEYWIINEVFSAGSGSVFI